MPLNPAAVGTTSEPAEFSWTSKDALLYAVSIGAGERRAGVHDREHRRRRPVRCSRRSRSSWATAPAARRDGEHRVVQPGDARPRPAGRHAAPADPAVEGTATRDVEADRHVRQGQGRRRRHDERRRDGRRAALQHAHRRRSSAARAAGAATVARPVRRTSRRTGRPTTRSRTRRRRTRRSCTGSTATATRCTPTRRSPPPAGSTSRSSTACAATASPVAACCTCCATATRRRSTTSRPASRPRSCRARR